MGGTMERLAPLVGGLAPRCIELYKTKLQKAMFFVDFLCYARNARSLTGLSYAHASYGPVMDGKDIVIAALQDCGAIELAEKDGGEIVIPKCNFKGILDENEVRLVDEVASFVKTFESSKDISSFSHKLSAWKDAENGQLIDYPTYAVQVEEAIERKIAV